MSDIQPTNLFKAFSTLEKTDNVNGMEFGAINLDLFEGIINLISISIIHKY